MSDSFYRQPRHVIVSTDRYNEAVEKIQKLEKALAKANEAVEFYADVPNWKGLEIMNDHATDFYQGDNCIFIAGKLARKTKKEIAEIMGGKQ